MQGARIFYYGMHAYCLGVFLCYDCDLRLQLAELRLFWPAAFGASMALATYLFSVAGERPGYVSRALDFREIPQMPQHIEETVGGKPVVSDRYEARLKEETKSLASGGRGVGLSEELDFFSPERQAQAFESLQAEEPGAERVREVPARHYCEHCQVLQPYRTKHCHLCQACVGKFDHHCFWIGGCVGELNHRKFYLMLLAMTAEFAIGLAYVGSAQQAWTGWTYNSPDDPEGPYKAYSKAGKSFATCTALNAGFLLFTVPAAHQLSLLGYHTYLIVHGLTTWESACGYRINYISAFPVGHYPFDRGVAGNLRDLFCHDGRLREWVLPDLEAAWRNPRFNCCVNKHYSCC